MTWRLCRTMTAEITQEIAPACFQLNAIVAVVVFIVVVVVVVAAAAAAVVDVFVFVRN